MSEKDDEMHAAILRLQRWWYRMPMPDEDDPVGSIAALLRWSRLDASIAVGPLFELAGLEPRADPGATPPLPPPRRPACEHVWCLGVASSIDVLTCERCQATCEASWGGE